MIGVLIATHASLGKELIAASELIFGKEERVSSVGLYHGDDIEALEGRIEEAILELDDGDGVLVFVDLLGGSPSNMTAKAMMTLFDRVNIECVAGVNLPVFIESLVARETGDLSDLKKRVMDAASVSIVDLRKTYGM